jgi:arsenate reductase
VRSSARENPECYYRGGVVNTMRITLFGIPNCDSCKKARRWLESNDIDYEFHDVRVDGLTHKDIQHWLKSAEWEKLLNTRSTTWRNLPEAERAIVDKKNVVPLLVKHPTLVKRPVLENGDRVTVGFSVDQYSDLIE